jgi:hypothetical protein
VAFNGLGRFGSEWDVGWVQSKESAKEEVLEGIEPPFLGGLVFEASEEAGSSQNRVY